MGRDNQPLYIQPHPPSLNERLRGQRDNLQVGPFTRLLLSVLLQDQSKQSSLPLVQQTHYKIKGDTGIIDPHLLVRAITQEEAQPGALTPSALDVDATNRAGDEGPNNNPYGNFFEFPQSSLPEPPPDPPHKRYRWNILISSVLCPRSSNTVTRPFMNSKPTLCTSEGEVATRNKDEEHNHVTDNTLGTQDTSLEVVEEIYSQQSFPRVRFRLFRWSYTRQSDQCIELRELSEVVDVPCARRRQMYYSAKEVELAKIKEKERRKTEAKRKAEAKEKRREGKKRDKQNTKKLCAGSSPPTQSYGPQYSAGPLQAESSSGSQTIAISSPANVIAPLAPISDSVISSLDETPPRAGCWTCFRSYICV